MFLDSLTGTTANAAYSLGRQLRTAYAGSAFQVRRSSDNTTLDIGFSAGVVNTASLLSFCSATNGFITKIYDQTANANDLVQATTGNQPQVVSSGALLNPIMGYPAAGGGFMTNTSIALPGSSTTLSALSASVNTGGASSARLWSFIASGGSGHDYDSNPSCLVNTLNTTGSVGAYRVSPMNYVAAALNATIVVATRWDGTNNTTTINGSSSTPAGSSAVFGTTGSLNFQHDGWNGGGTGEPWTGRTSEFIIAGVMSSGDFTTAQANILAYYTSSPLAGAVTSTSAVAVSVGRSRRLSAAVASTSAVTASLRRTRALAAAITPTSAVATRLTLRAPPPPLATISIPTVKRQPPVTPLLAGDPWQTSVAWQLFFQSLTDRIVSVAVAVNTVAAAADAADTALSAERAAADAQMLSRLWFGRA